VTKQETLDYFAGCALTGACADTTSPAMSAKTMACVAYDLAEVMMEERQRRIDTVGYGNQPV
jgi:hypothetical protein